MAFSEPMSSVRNLPECGLGLQPPPPPAHLCGSPAAQQAAELASRPAQPETLSKALMSECWAANVSARP